MLSYHAYKLIHLLGIFLLLLSLGGQLVQSEMESWRKLLKASHGVGLLLLFVAGFGLIARLGVEWPWPAWIYLKLFIWILLGTLPAFARRTASSGKVLWWPVLGLATFAAYLATFKPFV